MGMAEGNVGTCSRLLYLRLRHSSFWFCQGLTYVTANRRERPLNRPFRDSAEILVLGSIFFLLSALIVGIARTLGLGTIADPAAHRW